MKIELPYGRHPLAFESGDHPVSIVEPPGLPEPLPVTRLIADALGDVSFTDAPRVTVIVSDPTRNEPRQAFFEAVLERVVSDLDLTLAIATGTHGPCRIEDLGLGSVLGLAKTIVNHDGHRDDDLVQLGTTRRGTPVHVHRCLVETDLVIATGCILPHYFAGFGAGAKAWFPGLGQAAAIRINHRLKTEPLARAGIVDGNPCREDIEQAVAMIPTRKFLLNAVAGPDGLIHAVVAGGQAEHATVRTIDEVFREGVTLARPWFTAVAPRAPLVIASDVLPVSASLYQAAKIAAAVASLVEPGGTLALVAECPEGIGPLDTVNEAIFRIGVLPRLPPNTRLVLISALTRESVDRTLLSYAPSLDSLLAMLPAFAPITVVPRASKLLCEAASP